MPVQLVVMQSTQPKNTNENNNRRIAESVAKSDIIITTAQIPGKKASDFNYRRNAQFSEKWLCNYRFQQLLRVVITPFTKNNETVNY